MGSLLPPMNESKRKTVLIAVRKERRRYALRMCWEFERRGLRTRLVTDAPTLLAAEREIAPDVIIVDAAITQPLTANALASIRDRPDSAAKLILLDVSADEEPVIRDQWPNVEIIV